MAAAPAPCSPLRLRVPSPAAVAGDERQVVALCDLATWARDFSRDLHAQPVYEHGPPGFSWVGPRPKPWVKKKKRNAHGIFRVARGNILSPAGISRREERIYRRRSAFSLVLHRTASHPSSVPLPFFTFHLARCAQTHFSLPAGFLSSVFRRKAAGPSPERPSSWEQLSIVITRKRDVFGDSTWTWIRSREESIYDLSMIQENADSTSAACGREIDATYRYSCRKVSHCWRCYSKIVISEVLGRSEVSSRLPHEFENNLHVFGSANGIKFSKGDATSERICLADSTREQIWSVFLPYDSIAATLTGFITFTMFLMCSNPITITPMR